MYIMSRKYDNRDKEGHWLFPYKNAHGYKQCSVCGEIGYHSIYPYCPTCGAKMDIGYTTRKKDAYEAVSKIVEAWNNEEYPEYFEDAVGKILKEAGYI